MTKRPSTRNAWRFDFSVFPTDEQSRLSHLRGDLKSIERSCPFELADLRTKIKRINVTRILLVLRIIETDR